MCDRRIGREYGSFLVYPRIPAEVTLEDLLGGSSCERLHGKGWVWSSNAICERRIVRDEKPLDLSCFAIAVEHRVGGVRTHAHRTVTMNNEGRLIDPVYLLGSQSTQ